jgi:hypothetical protein
VVSDGGAWLEDVKARAKRATEDPGVSAADVPTLVAAVERLSRRLAGRFEESEKLRAEVARLTRLRDELRVVRNDLLDIRGLLSPNGGEPVTPFTLGERVAPAIEWLIEKRAEAVSSLAAVIRSHAGWRDVIEKAKAWREMRRGTPTKPKPESAALAAAVDALTQPSADGG